MIQELLVAIACFKESGCSQTTSAYYLSNPNMQQIMLRHKAKIKQIIGPQAVMIAPAVFMLTGRTGTIHLWGDVSLQTNAKDKALVIYEISF